MSIGKIIKSALGILAGILIPGMSRDTANKTQAIQQQLADAYGTAAASMAANLKLDTTGMTGSQKLAAVTTAIVLTAKRDGFKGDVEVLKHVAVDVAQAAFRSTEPNIGAAIAALGSSLSANPLVGVAAQLVGDVVQTAVDAALAPKIAA